MKHEERQTATVKMAQNTLEKSRREKVEQGSGTPLGMLQKTWHTKRVAGELGGGSRVYKIYGQITNF